MAGCLANARLHSRLVASERMAAVGQTLAGLSHCIKNILQGMQGSAFILQKLLPPLDLDALAKAHLQGDQYLPALPDSRGRRSPTEFLLGVAGWVLSQVGFQFA